VTGQVTPPEDATPLDPGAAALEPAPGTDPPAVDPPAVESAAADGLDGSVAAAPTEERIEEPAGEPEPAGQTPPEAEPRPNRSRLVKLVTISAVGLALVLALSAYAIVQYISGSVADAKVGSCIAGASAPKEGQESEAGKAKVVDCGSGTATFKVMARFEKKKLSEADAACQTHPEAPFVFTAIPNGGTGVVLCLAKL
jgi:hypothetical protein